MGSFDSWQRIHVVATNNWKRTEHHKLKEIIEFRGDSESEIEDKEIQTIKVSNAAEIKRNEQIQRNSNRFMQIKKST